MSFTLNYTGDEINAILARANNGGEIDDELALKAPLASPALTGNPTAPTQPEEDNSTKIATTEYADRAADAAGAAAEAAAKEYTDAATGALYITDTASGPIASFSDGANNIPMRSVVVNIAPVQSGSGDPSPDNVRPISGWTGAEVGQLQLQQGAYELANGEVDSPARVRTGGWLSATRSITVNIEPSNYEYFLFAADDASGTNPSQSSVWRDSGTTVTLAKDYVKLVIRNKTTPTASITPSDVKVAILGIDGVSVTWESQAGTVYGGTIDVVSGELKVTHKLLTMVSTGSWGYSSVTGTFYKEFSGLGLKRASYTSAFDGVADSFAPAPANANWSSGNYVGHYIEQTEGVRFSCPALNGDLDAFKTFINGKTVVFPLATPVIYQLTPTEVKTLLGDNNVWSNTGDVEVTYVADPKLYFAKILGGSTLTLGSVSPLSVNRPVAISEEDLEQAGEVSEAVEAAAETVLPAESGETEEGAQE